MSESVQHCYVNALVTHNFFSSLTLCLSSSFCWMALNPIILDNINSQQKCKISAYYLCGIVGELHPYYILSHVHCMKQSHGNHCDSRYKLLFLHKHIRFSVVELDTFLSFSEYQLTCAVLC
ncbi:hypothetical protein KUCAC02_022873 [Chaenocephalus aceratus]|uniref:Uncharacterized protein n=1 Tax=Chaenocephalus aceratus TaxID=36190 RepID=A0ACB9XPN1_CHAAC|nr:hypothetical protein KUCAC02_022873 [Chaenocephalus aceratus]